MDDGEIDATRQRAPGYDGEDVSPTTDRELTGWYSYGIAAEVFAVCGVGKKWNSYECILCFLMILSRLVSSNHT